MKILNKILNYIVFVAIVFVAVYGLRTTVYSPQSMVDSQQPKFLLDVSLDDVNKYYENADSISLYDVNSYYIFENRNLIGKVVNTSPYSDEIYGYNSITPLNIYLDSEDKIVEVEVCDNRESRGYLNKVISSGFLDLWDGMIPYEAARHHVDAVSGCTFSSTAIAQSLQIKMAQLSEQNAKSFSWDWSLFVRQLCVFIVTILALICFFNPKKKILRRVTLLLSIAVLGFWTNSLLSLALFCNWIANGVSLALQLPILIIAALAILLPLFTKKSFYCQYLCPFGAAQEFVGMLCSQKAKVESQKSSKIKSNIFKIFSILRKVILIVLLIIFAIGTGLDLSVVEPFPIFNYQSIGFGLAIFAAVILIISIFIKRPWCNYLCPTGTLLEAFRRVRN